MLVDVWQDCHSVIFIAGCGKDGPVNGEQFGYARF